MTVSLSGVSSMATRLILDELCKRYEAETGVAVTIKAMGGVNALDAVRAGGAGDIVALSSGQIAKLEVEGHVLRGSVVGFARSGMGVAVRAGAEKPDISDEAAVRRLALAGGRIGYSSGPSGEHLQALCARWGVEAGRLVKAPSGVPVASLVADGQADIAFQQLSELIHAPGIVLAGPLPPDIQVMTVFAAGVAATCRQPDAAKAFIAYLASPQTAEVKRAEGMEAV